MVQLTIHPENNKKNKKRHKKMIERNNETDWNIAGIDYHQQLNKQGIRSNLLQKKGFQNYFHGVT